MEFAWSKHNIDDSSFFYMYIYTETFQWRSCTQRIPFQAIDECPWAWILYCISSLLPVSFMFTLRPVAFMKGTFLLHLKRCFQKRYWNASTHQSPRLCIKFSNNENTVIQCVTLCNRLLCLADLNNDVTLVDVNKCTITVTREIKLLIGLNVTTSVTNKSNSFNWIQW